MALKSKTREISIVENEGVFSGFFRKFYGEKKEFDFEAVSALRKLLSKEKAKLLHIIKTQKPSSLYELAQILKRDLKAVKRDIKLLERFGFIDLIAEKSGKRERLKPVLVVDSIYINVKL